ncbi:Phosphoribosyl-AMP cyclohydrolase domain-containing protein [Cynara cardunculus var. scolymus]|uniref:Phosphoribosyl-AMP cyclohydrolase domain-containing protein n=1 Tax=Cynara cardunculus var. scolymus TaxID=59895 RepID=A0A103YE38_CYNCS|nr:Phosphoribosyl-AMP cyclohydrolase domain-containing protein [Cynara cardunculus var. scolymus]
MAFVHFNGLRSLQISSRGCIFNPGSGHTRSDISNNRCSAVKACIKQPDQKVHLESKLNSVLDSVKWDEKGLAVAIAQNVDSGAILMQGFANREALATTIASKKATFYSRSRSTLWIKGETSLNFINVHDIFLDCDRDSAEENNLALTTLYSLESTLSRRKEELLAPQQGKPSWTKRLLLDENEEADEFCRTLEENEDESRTLSEMADVLYHELVLLIHRGLKFEDVLEVLRCRFAQSGIDEKNSRKPKTVK